MPIKDYSKASLELHQHIASCVGNPQRKRIIPAALDKSVAKKVASAVYEVAIKAK